MSLLEHPARRHGPDGLAMLPQAVRYHDSFPPARHRHISLSDRLIAGLVILGLVLSLLAALSLGLFFVYIALELVLAIFRALKEALPR